MRKRTIKRRQTLAEYLAAGGVVTRCKPHEHTLPLASHTRIRSKHNLMFGRLARDRTQEWDDESKANDPAHLQDP